jgi:hypothetical protein
MFTLKTVEDLFRYRTLSSNEKHQFRLIQYYMHYRSFVGASYSQEFPVCMQEVRPHGPEPFCFLHLINSDSIFINTSQCLADSELLFLQPFRSYTLKTCFYHPVSEFWSWSCQISSMQVLPTCWPTHELGSSFTVTTTSKLQTCKLACWVNHNTCKVTGVLSHRLGWLPCTWADTILEPP